MVISKWELYRGNDELTKLYNIQTSQSGSYSSQYTSSNLFNDYHTYGPRLHWQVNNPPPQWVTVDFGVKVDVDGFVIVHDNTDANHNPYMPKDWDFQGSHDGVTWDTLILVRGFTSDKWVSKVRHEWIV